MPIYEFYCSGCDSRFELLRPFSKVDEDAACPKCNKSGKRLLSSFASFSKSPEGISSPIPGMGSACSSCAATSCDTCH